MQDISPTEKKYRVTSFENIKKLLKEVDAQQIRKIVSTHYYGRGTGNDVEKFVVYPDHAEIHVLKESDGKFTLTENERILDKAAGFGWLRKEGYATADVVNMECTEYAYKDGTIGLYILNSSVYSIILYYSGDKHELIEKELDLDTAEEIGIPYNKYLQNIGQLQSIEL